MTVNCTETYLGMKCINVTPLIVIKTQERHYSRHTQLQFETALEAGTAKFIVAGKLKYKQIRYCIYWN